MGSFPRNLTGEREYVKKYASHRLSLEHRDVRDALESQTARYLSKHPELDNKRPGTFYGKVILRAHNARTAAFSELWYQELRGSFVRRDQLSFQYCALEAGLDMKVLDTSS